MMQIDVAENGELLLFNKSHRVVVPASVVGLKYILQILRGQKMGKTKIAEEGAPTQWEIDKAVTEWKKKNPVLPKPAAKLSKYNVDTSELDL